MFPSEVNNDDIVTDTMVDITDKNALLSAILESSPDVIVFALDKNYRYLAYNKKHFETMKAIWGMEIAVGLNMLEIIGTEEDRKKAKTGFDRALSGESFSIIEDYGDENIQRLVWHNYYSPVMSKDDAVIGMTCYCLNVTERETVKKSLQDANNKLKIISSITRHDILNNLITLNALLDRENKRTTDQVTLAHIDKMVRIVENLETQMNFTKEYQEIGILKPEWQLVSCVCEDSKEHLDLVNIDVVIETGHLEIYADPMLKKVFYNLLDNSLKHGHKVTRIWIGYELTDDGTRVTYEDNGIGIELAFKKLLFDEGFGTNTAHAMFLIKEVLKITGITIIENGEPGKGSRFEMLVPTGRHRFEEE